MTPLQARINSLRNQMLASLDARMDDVCRVASSLPTDTPDEALIASVMCLMAGMLQERRGNAKILELEGHE